GAVGLEVGQVRPVRGADAGQGRVHAFGGEGGGRRFAEGGFQIAHGWPATPASIRKRLPVRFSSAISGVTSKPIRISKFEPLTVALARGMTKFSIASVTSGRSDAPESTGSSK